MMREFNCLLCSNFRWHNVKRSASTAYALHVYIIYIILIEMFESIRSTTLGNGYNWMEEKNVCYFILQNSSIQLVATVCLFLLPFFEKKKEKDQAYSFLNMYRIIQSVTQECPHKMSRPDIVIMMKFCSLFFIIFRT